mmetsp:Transcript_12796/g.32754  ORF Transcript_12796/g.32754 Transcript_12796/m.32754 type:complete len:244 (+) Transcript_12796:420-1151(+)
MRARQRAHSSASVKICGSISCRPSLLPLVRLNTIARIPLPFCLLQPRCENVRSGARALRHLVVLGQQGRPVKAPRTIDRIEVLIVRMRPDAIRRVLTRIAVAHLLHRAEHRMHDPVEVTVCARRAQMLAQEFERPRINFDDVRRVPARLGERGAHVLVTVADAHRETAARCTPRAVGHSPERDAGPSRGTLHAELDDVGTVCGEHSRVIQEGVLPEGCVRMHPLLQIVDVVEGAMERQWVLVR